MALFAWPAPFNLSMMIAGVVRCDGTSEVGKEYLFRWPAAQSYRKLSIEYLVCTNEEQAMSKRPPVPILPDDVEKLIAACNEGATGLRNRALLDLLHRSGLRIAEALGLMPSDLEPGKVRVRHGKGDVARVAGIVGGGSAWLTAWLRERERLGFNGRQRVFCTLKGEPISSRYIRALLGRLARKAGIDKPIRCHGFRHGFATLLAEREPLRVVSAALGHAHVSTTDNYINRLTGGEAAERVAALTF